MSAIYMASPYSNQDPAIRERRFQAACRAAGKLMDQGHSVFSPIAHSHPIALVMASGNATDHEFWRQQDIPWLRHAEKLVVLKLDGWEESRGVTHEIKVAMILGIPIEFVEPE